MTDTDRAFIAAYQQPGLVVRPAQEHGPHFGSPSPRPRRAPLSQLIGGSTPVEEPRPVASGVEIDSFKWPSLVDDLCQVAANELAEVLDSEIDVLALASAASGSGITTLVLALARIASNNGMSVTLLDAAPTELGLAKSLGVHRLPTLLDGFEHGLAYSACTIRSAADSVSLAAAGLGWDDHAASEALDALRETVDLVLIDLGSVEAEENQLAWSRAGATTLLVEGPEADDSQRSLLARLHQSGVKVRGLIQNFVGA